MATLTNRQKVYLYIGDTAEAIFTNDEIDSLLSDADQNVFLAASCACISMATDAARLALVVKIGDYSKDARAVARELSRRAMEFESKAYESPATGVALGNEPFSSHLGVIS